MNHSKTELNFLLFFLLITVVLAFFIFKPFLYAIILAIIVATVFEPVHKRVLTLTKGISVLSALLTTATVLVVVIVPLTFVGVQIFQESTQLYASLVDSGGVTKLSRDVDTTLEKIAAYSPVPLNISIDFSQYITQGLNWLLQHLGSLFASVAKIMMSIFIFLLALYYLFKDGHRLKKAILEISPLKDVYDEIIFNKLSLAVNSVVRGSLTVALVQGALTAIGLFLFSVPNPVLWGTVAAVAALVPGIGTALIIVPAVLYLYFSGEMLAAVGLLIWGVTAVGLVDNFLGPKLVEKGIRLHSFLVLLSILGGLSFFGPVGFLLGPLVLSLLFVLLEIYSAISKHTISN
jgi:predicted PurR-regulated permease PerM